ncbi:MAG: hypothetical protein HY514_05430, partial [Candidatus Aenigmarchaeota archaeon]|nr:hypothetical protein [Candidatus Aenigmarchaeota archaeon]
MITKIKTKDKTTNETIFILFILITFLSFSVTANAQTTQRCRGNEICEVSVQGGQLVYDNCQSCGTNIVSCPNDVRPVVVDRVCRNVGVAGAQCADGQAKCSGTGLADPNKVLKFTVYIPKSLIVSAVPEARANIAGRKSDYKITIENKNPVGLDLVIGAEAGQEWKTEFPATLQLGAKSKKDFTLKVTSPEGTPDSDYSVLVTAFGFQSDDNNVVFNGQKTVTYQVASRAAASVAVEPTTQTGIRGEKLAYNILLTNNDPKDFDASTVALSAKVPAKWTANFASRSVRIKPSESATVKLDVTSDENAKQGPYDIEVNATANGLANYAKAQYIVTTCGDGMCGLGEQCAQDCPLETWFSCNGRCERQTDVGVDFSAQVKFAFTNFVICSRNSTTEQCKSAFNANRCGIGKSCLCGNRFDPACSMRCVDNDGAYYLSAGELGSAQIRRSNANYSFECPFVNLDEIKGMKDDFNAARQDFEKSRSGLKEQLNTATRDQKENLLPCYDGLGEIITVLKDHVKYIDEVIKFPAVSNTTEARAKSADVRASVDATYNSFCRGATGALQIVSLDVGTVEKGKNARASIVVKNAGNVNYYGYVACDFTSPQGKKNTTNTTCTPMSFGKEYTFDPEARADAEGTWKVQCKTIGSLKADCSSEVHDQSGIVMFDVFSRDTFVRDVSGTCTASGATCTVRLSNNFACAGCRIENNECTKRSQTNDTTVFSCPRG